MSPSDDTPFRFCFTLDTEPDNLWDHDGPCAFENFKRVPGFHRRLIAAGARPTYLTTSEVAEDRRGRAALEACLGEGGCEIGSHFHTWTRRWPFPVNELAGDPVKAMAHRLGQRVEADMLAYTCEVIDRNFGRPPESFRGGRWSLGSASIPALVRCGIKVDSTVTPGISWSDESGGLTDGSDYTLAPMQPHFLVSEEPPSAPLLELPIGTAVIHPRLRRLAHLPWLRRRVQRVLRAAVRRRSAADGLHRLLHRLGLRLGVHWLRPTDTSTADMRAVMLALRHQRCPIWVFIVHSSELIPCRHLPSEDHVARFTARCLEAVETARALGARPATLSEAARWVAERHSLPRIPAARYLSAPQRAPRPRRSARCPVGC